jgi:DNA ligase (NAD+)
LINEGPPQNLQGKAIVVSGNLRKLTREAAESAIRVRGGRSPGSVSRKTFALVLGENPGANKQRSARDLNIPVLDEAGFEVLLETGELPK